MNKKKPSERRVPRTISLQPEEVIMLDRLRHESYRSNASDAIADAIRQLFVTRYGQRALPPAKGR